jgi:beta-lactamase class A
MANAVAVLLTTTSALSSASSTLLYGWMRACETGTAALRAGIPKWAWTVADKTGSGDNGTRNDVALLRRWSRAPIVISAYLTGATAIDADKRDAALAEVATTVVRGLDDRSVFELISGRRPS